MGRRVLALAKARLRALGWDVAGPLGPLLMHAAVTALLCGLVRDGLAPFPYAVFALALSAILVAIPLLGEFGGLLRADPTGDWIEAQPVTPRELRIARALSIQACLLVLGAGSLLPAVLLAPAETSLAGRALLALAGLEQAVLLAVLLLWLQSLLGERAEGLLVLLQTALVVGGIVGLLVGLRHVPALARLTAPGDAPLLPQAWLALPLAGAEAAGGALRLLPHVAVLAGVALLYVAPAPARPRAHRTASPLGLLLRPVRALALRVWVRRDERGVFDLVYDALPAERDFVLRTYPMVGIPLAFLWLGAGDEAGPERDGALSLLLFTTAAYLPILLAHVPVTATPEARWLLDTAPLERGAVHAAAYKAVAVRFFVPLYTLLAVLCVALGSADLALRLALPAALLALLVMRLLYQALVTELPLSTRADELEGGIGGVGVLMTLAIVLTILSVVALRVLDTPARGALATGALLALHVGLELADRRAARAEEP